MFNEFVGNNEAVEIVRNGIIAAMIKKTKLPNYLFAGSAGSGKTMLAKLIAKESLAHCAYFNASMIQSPKDIVCVIKNAIEDYNNSLNCFQRVVIVCDEAHALKPNCQDFLLTCISENVVTIKERNGNIINYPIKTISTGENDFLSWIFVSNRCGEMAQALRTRLVRVNFIKYDENSKIAIAKNYYLSKNICTKKMTELEFNDVLKEISNRSYNIRELKSNIDELHNYIIVNNLDYVSKNIVVDYFTKIGLDENGLDQMERRYIEILAELGNKASVQTIASKLGIGTKDVQELIEPKLMELKKIEIDSSGRHVVTKHTRDNPFSAK